MSTRVYTLPVEQTRWKVAGGAETVFTWEYDEGRDRLLNLYEKGKNKQWNSRDRIDWSIDVDLENPIGGPEAYVPIYGSRIWESMGERDRAQLFHHMSSWQFSQFLHGEQGALICASKIVQTVPDIDSKFYAATQVMDEARHVETYSRFLHEKLQLAYPINAHLKALLDDVVSDSRWDMTYLGMQVLIEGLALAAFGLYRDVAANPLAKQLLAY
ncbi:MAG TPA: aminobenzoate oxygenase, partial [Dehalococcoidia bacterium]|nr:aminobenzoate oxygenase [Dehalococcoidia bacterium]